MAGDTRGGMTHDRWAGQGRAAGGRAAATNRSRFQTAKRNEGGERLDGSEPGGRRRAGRTRAAAMVAGASRKVEERAETHQSNSVTVTHKRSALPMLDLRCMTPQSPKII